MTLFCNKKKNTRKMENIQIKKDLKGRFYLIKSHNKKENLQTNQPVAIHEPYLDSI